LPCDHAVVSNAIRIAGYHVIRIVVSTALKVIHRENSSSLRFIDSGLESSFYNKRLAGINATKRVRHCDETGDASRRNGCDIATKRVPRDLSRLPVFEITQVLSSSIATKRVHHPRRCQTVSLHPKITSFAPTSRVPMHRWSPQYRQLTTAIATKRVQPERDATHRNVAA
jgi:hypothetical protein